MATPINHSPLLDYVNAVYQYRLIAVCVFVCGVLLTAATVYLLPNMYRSTTLIMVEPQDVPQAFVKATVTTRVEERLNTLSQEVLSRTRLEAIIKDFDLFHDLVQQGAPREQLVAAMRSKIQTQVFARDNAFRISYEGSDPAVVQRVTARLASLYIDENLRSREEHVAGTTEFLESELEKVKKQLEDQEAQIESFKQQHMGELPEQQETNLRALDGLRMQLETVSTSLSAARTRKVLLERQAVESSAARRRNDGGGRSPLDPRAQLADLEAQLVQLRSRYREEHPDVLRTRRQIARLRAEIAASPNAAAAAPPPEIAHALSEVSVEIARLVKEKENVQNSIQVYQKRVENSFTRQQQLLGLTRDYDVTQHQYQSMLDKKLDAQVSQSLERRQKGERFRVLDPASLPEAPARPNRKSLLLGGAGASLGLAFLLPVLLWKMDPSFRGPDEIAAYSVPVVAVIPRMQTANVLQRQRLYRLRVISLSATGLAIALYAVRLYARYVF